MYDNGTEQGLIMGVNKEFLDLFTGRVKPSHEFIHGTSSASSE